MRCSYCFYHNVSEIRSTESFGKMNEETASALIKSAVEFAGGESICFAFQGGEPLLAGIDFFRFFVAKAEELNTSGSVIYYTMQTNGLMINEEWAEFLHKNSFLVGLSLDGDFIGNRFRLDAEGGSTHQRVLSKAELLKKYKVDFNILTVLTGDCAERIDKVYRYFTSRGFRYLQFIPCLRPFGSDTESELYMTSEQYSDFLIKLFNFYVKDYMRGNYTSIRMFDNWVRLYLGDAPEQCGMLGYCSHQFVVEGNGNVYPCDFYCTDNWLLGNINEISFEYLSKSQRAEKFIKDSLVIPAECKSCRFYGICRSGGCKRSREDRNYCEAYKRFFSACLPLFRVFANEKRK